MEVSLLLMEQIAQLFIVLLMADGVHCGQGQIAKAL